jgi:FkbM family methyltransferase
MADPLRPRSQMLRLLAQTVRDLHLAYPEPTGYWGQGCIWVLVKTEAVLRRVADPIIKYKLGDRNLQLPLSHRLPLFRKRFPHYGVNLGRVVRHVKGKYPDMTMIDVGANIGDSVAIVRAEAMCPILCIEGDPSFLKLLIPNAAQFDDVYCVQTYVGDVNGEIRGSIERRGGTARIDASRANGGVIAVRTLRSILDQYPRFNSTRLLKIDTDGYDGRIIRGDLSFLSERRPVIFFEYDPRLLATQGDDGLSLFTLMREIGYRDLLVYHNTGPLMEPTRTDDAARLATIHASCGRGGNAEYVDVAAYHGQDGDLFAATLRAELEHFRLSSGANPRPSLLPSPSVPSCD